MEDDEIWGWSIGQRGNANKYNFSRRLWTRSSMTSLLLSSRCQPCTASAASGIVFDGTLELWSILTFLQGWRCLLHLPLPALHLQDGPYQVYYQHLLHNLDTVYLQGQRVWRLRGDVGEEGDWGFSGWPGAHLYSSNWRLCPWRWRGGPGSSQGQAEVKKGQKSWLGNKLAWAFSVARLAQVHRDYVMQSASQSRV